MVPPPDPLLNTDTAQPLPHSESRTKAGAGDKLINEIRASSAILSGKISKPHRLFQNTTAMQGSVVNYLIFWAVLGCSIHNSTSSLYFLYSVSSSPNYTIRQVTLRYFSTIYLILTSLRDGDLWWVSFVKDASIYMMQTSIWVFQVLFYRTGPDWTHCVRAWFVVFQMT